MAYQPPHPIVGPDFLEQFRAGWQMGMARKESQRRDQMMQQEMEREAFDRQQRLEALKLQKQEIDLRMKRAKQEDTLRDFALRQQASSLQGLPAPTAADVWIQQAVPDVGPPGEQINVPQPTMTIPGVAGPDVEMPVLTGRQQAEMAQAAQQAKMREAIGLDVAKAQAMEPFEQRKFEREAGLKRELATQKTKQLQSIMGAFGTAKTEGQQKGVEIAQYGISKMPEWQKFIKENKDKFGFYAGRLTEAEQSGALKPFGYKPTKEMAKFKAELANVSSAILNALSGAAISPQEFERLKQFIPQVTDEPEALEAKMESLDDFFKFRLKNFNAPYQGPGWEKQPVAAPQTDTGTSPGRVLGTWYGVEILGDN